MDIFRFRLLLTLILLAFLASACAESVVLLPNQEGHVGAVVITPHDGQPTVLDQAYAQVDVSESNVGEATVLTQEQVASRYAKVLEAEPDAPLKYYLYFFNDETRLKPDSKALLPEIVAQAQARQSKDVSVVGHTDRAGDAAYNMQLSSQRARNVAKLLVKLGLDPEIMEITSHGENNPLVPTADGKHEPRNRRVEVTIR